LFSTGEEPVLYIQRQKLQFYLLYVRIGSSPVESNLREF
jgi:hypothetical protein